MSQYQWDVFISYAHEDRAYVNQLAHALKSAGLDVWYDQFIMEVGDSLTKKINEGLARSRFGVVVLSLPFFQKNWTQVELAALLNREEGDQKVILPIWRHGAYSYIKESAPIFLDRVALDSTYESIETTAKKIIKAVKPELSQNELDPKQLELKIQSKPFVLLPCHPSDNRVVALSRYPVTNKEYQKYLEELSVKDKEHIKVCIILQFRDYKPSISFEEPIGKHFDGKHWKGPFKALQDNRFDAPEQPVVNVSLFDAFAFTRWLNKKNSNANYNFIIPTPELWDFAAFGSPYPDQNPQSWINSMKSIHHQSTAPAIISNNGERMNSLGISDMFGNVWEWCLHENRRPAIIMAESSYAKAELRGGSYLDDLNKTSPFVNASSLTDHVSTRHTDLGFRVAVVIQTNALDKKLLEYMWSFEFSVENIVGFDW